MKIDIPGELQELERQLPGVSLRLAAPLGADMRLVEVVRARVLEAGGPFAADAREASGFADPACASSCDGGAAAEHAGISAASGDTSALAPHPIESESFAIIDALLGVSDEDDPEYQITRRVIHATGDPSLAASLSFSPRAVAAGVEALLAGSNIICDVNMVAAGLCPSAAKLGREAVCGIAEAATETLAHSAGITRAAAALRRVAANDRLAGAIVAVGNAPTALFECLRLASMEGIRPALVIGVPVGFVGAAESKQALQQSGLEYIALPGNRGGSSIAVAIAGALLRLAAAGAE